MPTTTPSSDPAERPDALLSMAQTVHTLYQQAQTQAPDAFEAQVFHAMARELSFDAAWLGHSTLTPQGAQLHSSALYQLHADYPLAWSRVQAQDPLVAWAQGRPTQTTIVTVADAGLHPDFRGFLAQQGIAQILCAATVDATVLTCLHVSLYRQGFKPAFASGDQLRLQALMPNLAGAIALNRVRAIENASLGQQVTELGVALLSRQGVVQVADPRFGPLVQREWPDWPGGSLPAAVMAGTGGGGQRHFVGHHIDIALAPHGDLLIATARPRSRSSVLTARERAVATRFAQGQTYKAVARSLGIAPATVRHHLRQVYSKLGIQDKGAIAWALSQELGGSGPSP